MITDEMVEQAAMRAFCQPSDDGDDATPEGWKNVSPSWRARCLDEARAVLEYAATLGPSREERLVAYRCAALSPLVSDAKAGWRGDESAPKAAASVEVFAHAMLAAERPAESAPEVDPFKLCATAIRRVRDVIRAEPNITPEGVIEEFERATRRPCGVTS